MLPNDNFYSWKYDRDNPRKPWREKAYIQLNIMWGFIWAISTFLINILPYTLETNLTMGEKLILSLVLPGIGCISTLIRIIAMHKEESKIKRK
jgi:hypothetical protein